MSERDDLYLEHVLQAIARIERFTSGGREVFVVDEMVQSAVIRQLEIVGEAVRNLSDELKARKYGGSLARPEAAVHHPSHRAHQRPMAAVLCLED